MHRSLAALTLLAFASCAPTDPDAATLLFDASDDALVEHALTGLRTASRFALRATSAPRDALRLTTGHALAVERDTSLCAECYRFEREDLRVTLTAGGDLGLQYGLAHWLESLGYGFFHPFRTREPEHLPKRSELISGDVTPDIARRGLHLHTLHPTEALFDFWVPGEEHLQNAERTIDWLVRNRGNYLQWAALDDLRKNATTASAWKEHTRRIIAFAHARGVQVGLTVQLFDAASLQQSFTLIDASRPDDDAALLERLRLVLEDVPFDNLNISFGEFFGADPQAFIDRVDTTHRLLTALRPDVSMSAVVHVGDTPELRVTWQGRTQLYYFLVRYVNPAITPRVHTVMFYNLFDSAGGAYRHRDFGEHREFLRERIERGDVSNYYPESAYWVAFDNSVPVYLPVYLRSRFVDLKGLRAMGGSGLTEHLLFSSGWEWGYWQNDALTLRMSHHLPERWADVVREAFASYGAQGEQVSALIERAAEVQHEALIVQELAPWLAGRDQVIDAAATLGHIAAPDRPALSTLGEDFELKRTQLDALATQLEAIAAEASVLRSGDPFLDEVVDGLDITAARARFIWAVTSAAQAFNRGQPHEAFLSRARIELARGERLAGLRRRGFHHPDSALLVSDGTNPTFYDYGYLRDANTLCFWKRELAQVRNWVEQAGALVPGCVL